MIRETTRRPRKARIEHVCDECQTLIEKGTFYIGSSMQDERGAYTPLKRHEDCLAAADIIEAEITIEAEYRPFLFAMIKANPGLKINELLDGFPEVLERLNGEK